MLRCCLYSLLVSVLWGVTSSARADVWTDAPESKAYTLVYSLNIPLRGGYGTSLPAYTEDKSDDFKGTFARIAYYLSLETAEGKRQFLYVSMDAFTRNIKHIGIPVNANKVQFQQKVKQLNIISNVKSIQTGTGINTGSIEFWPTEYDKQNNAKVPDASQWKYDFGDFPKASGNYGCMQVHNYGAKQTLFAYNGWGSDTLISDLGIGNNGVMEPKTQIFHWDWTLRHNANDYTKRLLQVLVLPGKTPEHLLSNIHTPRPLQVIQRQPGDTTEFVIQGTASQQPEKVEARLIARRGGEDVPWRLLDAKPAGEAFSGKLDAKVGWYRLELRYLKAGKQVGAAYVDPFGIGEVFIIAGQSNSANTGKTPLQAKDERVTNYGYGRWVPAVDPLLIATGPGGSPWSVFGDLFAAQWNVPVGLISVGVGGTAVRKWLPNAKEQFYERIKEALKLVGPYGARAILWHQGESDAADARTKPSDYAGNLRDIIAQSRRDGGWNIPWMIAIASYLPKALEQGMQAVRKGQKMAIDADPDTHEGPDTDDMLGSAWRHDLIHFNATGLKEHGRRWFVKLSELYCPQLKPKGADCTKLLATLGVKANAPESTLGSSVQVSQIGCDCTTPIPPHSDGILFWLLLALCFLLHHKATSAR